MEMTKSSFEQEDVETHGIGAGVLPVGVDDLGVPHVLLGRERLLPAWKASCKWSGFEGSRKTGETMTDTATREFLEESLRVVKNSEHVCENILQKKYLMRIVLKILNERCREPKYHCTYLVPVEYDPLLPQKFLDTRLALEKLHGDMQEWMHWKPDIIKGYGVVGPICETEDGTVTLTCRTEREECVSILQSPWVVEKDSEEGWVKGYFTGSDARAFLVWERMRESLEKKLIPHPCLSVVYDNRYNRLQSLKLINDHLEKDQIRWWTLDELQMVLYNRGTYGLEKFRPYFLPVLQTLLAERDVIDSFSEVFPRRDGKTGSSLSEEGGRNGHDSQKGQSPPDECRGDV